MKNKYLAISIVLIAAFGLYAPSSSVSQTGKSTSNNIGYRFESEPRAVFLTGEMATVRDPKLLMRTSNLYALAVYKSSNGKAQLGLATSKDGGDTFEPPVMISEPMASVSSHGENSPTLAVSGRQFYALWEQTREGGGADLMFARTPSSGGKFEKPIRVTDKTTPSSNGFSYLSVAPNGDIYAVWLDGRDRQANEHGHMHGSSGVYLAKSTDKGATFGKNVRLAADVCPCCRPTITFGKGGEVHVSWRAVYHEDIRDIVVSTSTDGATFNPAVRVAIDNWKISGCPHSGPSMVSRGGRLYVTWYSEGDGTNAGVRLAWSDDAGKTFKRPVIASGEVLDPNHPVLSFSEDGRLILAFQGRDPAEKDGWGVQRVYLAEVGDAGTVSRPVAVTGNKRSVSYPSIVAGSVGRVFVAWTEGSDKGANVFLSRGRRGIDKTGNSNPD